MHKNLPFLYFVTMAMAVMQQEKKKLFNGISWEPACFLHEFTSLVKRIMSLFEYQLISLITNRWGG